MKRKSSIGLIISLLSISTLCFLMYAFAEDVSDSYKKANMICAEAMALIKQGKLDEGLEKMRQTIIVAPKEGDWHLNYASILFTKGQQVFQAGDREKGKAIFSEVEKELMSAIDLYRDKDTPQKSQCYFLLGDIYFYVYEDKGKAKPLYQKALEFNPEHSGALEALKGMKE